MKFIKSILAVLCLSAGVASLTSCNDKIEVQQIYDYALETMPVQSELLEGETAEIRCKLIKSGYYEDAKFTIRYFQTEGYGVLKMDNGTIFSPNDSYSITHDNFKLFYTSHSTDQQSIDIYVEDNFGQLQKYSFSWTNRTPEEDSNEYGAE